MNGVEYKIKEKVSDWGKGAPVPLPAPLFELAFCESGFSGFSSLQVQVTRSGGVWNYAAVMEAVRRRRNSREVHELRLRCAIGFREGGALVVHGGDGETVVKVMREKRGLMMVMCVEGCDLRRYASWSGGAEWWLGNDEEEETLSVAMKEEECVAASRRHGDGGTIWFREGRR
ncbi:hypothetical protein LR48_Vigan08g042400 [Vigna angularis]|uniref:Uncharacterized protein n=1 Tax=Phaseolus angularis TaxID=3914 RepID=A0A0L9V3V2_PHAAN|nr:hypothetical protein LR48_Vigan08g042400 [Vigna angularis]